jgi:hypothetical protein
MMSRIFMIVGSAVLFVCSPCDKAGAVSAEVAKKCEAAVVAALPPGVPSDPTAGSVKGNVRDQRAYLTSASKTAEHRPATRNSSIPFELSGLRSGEFFAPDWTKR